MRRRRPSVRMRTVSPSRSSRRRRRRPDAIAQCRKSRRSPTRPCRGGVRRRDSDVEVAGRSRSLRSMSASCRFSQKIPSALFRSTETENGSRADDRKSERPAKLVERAKKGAARGPPLKNWLEYQAMKNLISAKPVRGVKVASEPVDRVKDFDSPLLRVFRCVFDPLGERDGRSARAAAAKMLRLRNQPPTPR